MSFAIPNPPERITLPVVELVELVVLLFVNVSVMVVPAPEDFITSNIIELILIYLN